MRCQPVPALGNHEIKPVRQEGRESRHGLKVSQNGDDGTLQLFYRFKTSCVIPPPFEVVCVSLVSYKTKRIEIITVMMLSDREGKRVVGHPS